jgi:hypothetical protein
MDEQDMYTDEDYLDQQDFVDQQERGEDNLEELESSEWADVPTKRKQESLYVLFNNVWKTRDSSKVANLKEFELGKVPLMTVRDSQYLGLLGSTFRHKKFANFFLVNGEILLSTSASRKGWFTELFVSQKKFTSRASSNGNASGQDLSNTPKSKWNFFGAKKTSDEAQ